MRPFDVRHANSDLKKAGLYAQGVGVNTRIVMEHTSMYWKPIALTLKKAGFFVFVVNAMLIHDFRDNTNIEESAIDGTKHNRRTIYKVQKIYLKFHQTKPYRPASMATGFCTGFFREKEQM